MRIGGWLGWAVAGVLALAWLGADRDEKVVAPSSQTPSFVQPTPVERPTTEGGTPQVFVQPSLPAQHDQIVEEKPSAPTILFTTTNVRLRASPSTSAAIVRTVPPRTPIESVGHEAGWHKVNVGRDQGWIRQDLLSSTRPALQESREPPSAPAAPLARQAPDRQSGQPLRDPYVGTCDCPYDLMRNGRLCGGRSAYSRPGGRSPSCYF